MSENTNARDIIELALGAAEPGKITDDLHTFVVPAGAALKTLDLRDHGDNPRRKTGTVKVADADSFVAYVRKHELPQTEVWADLVGTKIVAVINAHTESVVDEADEGAAGHGDHRAILAVRKTDAWEAWTALDRKSMWQQQFAEHIEDRAIDIVKPTGAEMLELAQSFQAKQGVEFESSKRLSSGESQLVYKETVAAKAGQRGQLDIPAQIELALTPFEGAPAYKVTARFRYRIKDGHLALSYALERPDDVLREAFLDVVTLVEGDLDRKVYRGTPE
jgi:uncharacterized protein YfdQ (DUF2303 family)